LKAILFSIDLIFSLFIFFIVLVLANIILIEKNDPNLFYYEANNLLEFNEDLFLTKDAELINNSIKEFLTYDNFYLQIKYYDANQLISTITINNFKHNNNFCSSKIYYKKQELIDATMCLWRNE
jgi:hypothetical protein